MSKKKVEEKSMKDKFIELMNRQGFTSVNSFSKACGIDNPNVNTNIKGVFKLSISRAFVYADTLGVPVMDVLQIFYPKECEANETAVKNYKVPVAK